MKSSDFPQLLAFLVTLILLVICAYRFRAQLTRLLEQARQELRRFPVYSAETTESREAEFIRDRLPLKKHPLIVLVVVVLFGALVWWLER